jgi:hypothetical protein
MQATPSLSKIRLALALPSAMKSLLPLAQLSLQPLMMSGKKLI